ncbi:MAG: hypothetical protein IT442_09020 [Phycisphaeraceae bacterium]|nr:hypothetical protein [Phycisphaeraceae bacterium]
MPGWRHLLAAIGRFNLQFPLLPAIAVVMPFAAIALAEPRDDSVHVALYLPDTSSQIWDPIAHSTLMNDAGAIANCENCHQVNPLFSHPTGVTAHPSAASNLPLENGLVTCITCHDNSSQAHQDAKNGVGKMLREMPNGQSLCAACHEASSGQHAGGLGLAHLKWENPLKNQASDSVSEGTIDALSLQCLTCHDGTTGKSLGLSHPIAVSQDRAAREIYSGSLAYTAPNRLDSRVPLFDGLVGCVSCHSPYSQIPKRLVIDNTHNQLCLTCHEQRR